MTLKVAMVNNTTHIVKNIIIVNSLNDIPPAGYHFAEVKTIAKTIDSEVKALQDLIKEMDPSFEIAKLEVFEKTIELNKTKWTSEKGFH